MLLEWIFMVVAGTILLQFLSWLHPEQQDEEQPLNSASRNLKNLKP
jgi:hypothetical protein